MFLPFICHYCAWAGIIYWYLPSPESTEIIIAPSFEKCNITFAESDSFSICNTCATGQLHPLFRVPVIPFAKTEHNSFVVRTENGNLIFTFGDQASHGGEFVFANGMNGTLNKGWSWPVAQVLQILKLSASAKVMLHFSNEGAMMVTVDSGLGKYQYIIPAQAQ